MSKYTKLLETATETENKLTIFANGWGLITGPKWRQGIWVSPTIIEVWRLEGWL